MTSDIAQRRSRPDVRIWLIGIAVALACMAYVFAIPLGSELTWFYGDSTDGLIEVALLEHWRNVLTGAVPWNEAGYFYPTPDTLGFNDTYFLPGLEYAVARSVLDPLTATMLTHATLRLIGFSGMVFLLRRVLVVDVAMALVGAALFTCANAAVMQMWHGQLNHLGIAPWFLATLVLTYRALSVNDRGQAWRCGALAAVIYGLWALSAFYFVWFTTLFVIVTTIALLAIGGAAARRSALTLVRANMLTLAALAAMFVVALIPFLTVYIPQLMRGEQHDWGMVYAFLPDPVTFFNVGGGNLVWGKLFVAANDRFFPGNQIGGEDIVGFPLATLILTLVAAVWCWRHRTDAAARVILASLIATAAILLLMLRVPGLGSAWKIVFHLVPGGGSIRAICRFFIFATMVQFAALALWLSRAAMAPAVKIAVVVVLVLEQVQLTPPVHLNRPQTLAMLEQTPPPPVSCRSIFVMSGRTQAQLDADTATIPWVPGETPAQHAKALADMDKVYRRNVDAMLIAAVLQRPAINGYASFLPPDWDFLTRSRADMIDVARRYARRHHLTDVCALDRTASPQWFPI